MSLISAVLLVCFVALIVLGACHELRTLSTLRRAGLDQPRHHRRLRRRLLGLFFLSLSVALLTNASAFEHHVANPFLRLGWIGMAFVFVLIAVWLAFRDLSETGKMAKEEAQRVVIESLATLQDEIRRVKQEKSGKNGEESPTQGKSTDGRPGSKSRRSRPPKRRA